VSSVSLVNSAEAVNWTLGDPFGNLGSQSL
jgi:hypothetical protein